MGWMFSYSVFNGDISGWDVSNVRDMREMFTKSQFTSDISKWKVRKDLDMKFMFNGCPMKKLPGWYKEQLDESFEFNNVSKERKYANIYNELQRKYRQCNIFDLSEKDYHILKNLTGICKVTDNELKDVIEYCTAKFGNTCFLNWLDVSDVHNMGEIFNSSDFNGDISKWDVSNVTDMSWMFRKSVFTGDISRWDVSNVTNMCGMFSGSSFNGDISDWDVSNVTDMSWMFYNSKFNGDISKWDVSKVDDMQVIFSKSKFNGDIS